MSKARASVYFRVDDPDSKAGTHGRATEGRASRYMRAAASEDQRKSLQVNTMNREQISQLQNTNASVTRPKGNTLNRASGVVAKKAVESAPLFEDMVRAARAFKGDPGRVFELTRPS